MRILWITNMPLPPICEALGLDVPAVGGWMFSSLKRLKANTQIKCGVATVYAGEKLIMKDIDDIRYYLLPLKDHSILKYNKHLEKYWINIKNDFNPDVIHIHGTEFPHGLAYVNACGSKGAVISIQGMISVIARYYTANIDKKNLKFCFSLRDLLRNDGIRKEKNEFENRGKYEIEILQRIDHIIGRTDWDRDHCSAINPKAKYHHVGETLRDSFYNNKWTYSECEPNTIFVSQASYPVKGLHKLLEAMPLILNKYPNTKIYVSGSDPTARPWYLLSTYAKYLKKLILKYNLSNNIEFLGMIDEKTMCERYLKSNVFVCCSSIENSPNSLGEAQMLRMPHVASFVGGIPEIVNYNPDVLYRFEETEMLARKICDIFKASDKVKIPNFNEYMYSAKLNNEQLMEAYRDIIK